MQVRKSRVCPGGYLRSLLGVVVSQHKCYLVCIFYIRELGLSFVLVFTCAVSCKVPFDATSQAQSILEAVGAVVSGNPFSAA